jgi:hypothetical protein
MEFISFWLVAFCWQNHYHVMLLFSQGCHIFQSIQIFRVYFSDMERALLWQVQCHKHKEGYFRSFRKILCRFKLRKVESLFPSGRPSKASWRSSVSNIYSDDVAIPSGCPSVSKRFKLFKLASVRMSQQHVRTLFRVQEDSRIPVHPSGRHGNTVRTLVRV